MWWIGPFAPGAHPAVDVLGRGGTFTGLIAERRGCTSENRAGSLARRSALLLAAIAFWISGPAHAISITDQIANQFPGGAADYFDSTNQYPNVVSLFSGGSFCTGSLINSRTILTAAHCFFDIPPTNQWAGGPTQTNPTLPIPSVSFASIAGPTDPIFRGVTSIFVNRDYRPGVNSANDIAVITLSNPVTSIAPVTLMNINTPLPTPGTNLVSVGYGRYGKGTDCCKDIDNKRRVMNTELGGYFSMNSNTNQQFVYAEFRSPNQFPNTFNLMVPTAIFEGGTARGDSGGPVFINTATGLVQIGELAGFFSPTANEGLYGDISDWTPLNLFLTWLAQNNPLRQVSAAPGNFKWSNPAAWIDEVPGVAGAVPNNTIGNVADYQFDIARYYQVRLSNPGTITLDMNPTIDTLAIDGAQSQLILPAGFTLTTVLSTTLSAGTLAMSGGTLSSPEMLISGGLLTGNGTIIAGGGNTGLCAIGVCNTGGTVLPVGTLTVQGNYSQTGGGVLAYQLSPAGTSGTLAVQGTASLGGTLAATIALALYPTSTRYAGVLTAGAVNGQFAQVTSSASSIFLTLMTTYTPTSVDLTLNRTPFGAVPGLSANQRAVGNALEAAYSTTLTGPAATLYTNLLMTGTPNALSQLSGEGITAAQNAAFASGRMFDSLMMDQGAFWRSGETTDSDGITFREAPLAYAAEKKKPAPAAFKELKPPPPAYQPRAWRLWTGGFGGAQSFNGDASVGSANASTSAAGGAMGFDYQVDPTRLVGVAVGGSESHFSVPDRATSGNLLGGHVGAYGVATWGTLYAAGVLSYSRFDNDVRRTIAAVGPSEAATGRFASNLLGARLELGRSYALPWINVTPFAAVQTSTLWDRGFTETSSAGGLSGILGLTYQSQTATSLPTFLGVQLDTRLTLYNMVWSPFVRTAWVHEFRPDRSIASSFVSVPGTLFAVDGARAWSDAVKVNAGSRLALNRYASLFASFDGEFANSGHSYAGRGGVRFNW